VNKALKQLETLQAATGVAALNTLRLGADVPDGDSVGIGSRVYECDDRKESDVAAGRVRVPVFNGHANATLNFDDTQNVVDGNTVTVGTKVYTFKAVLSNVDGHVKIGPTITRSIYNLVAAMNVGYPDLIDVPACYGELNDVGEGRGIAYATAMTRNLADINAFFGGDFDLQIAHWPGGAAGNSIALASTLIGNSGWAEGAQVATVPPPSAAQFAAALVTALNNDPLGSVFAENLDGEVVVWSRRAGDVRLPCSSSFTDAGNEWEWTTLLGGLLERNDLAVLAGVARVVTQEESNQQRMHFVFGLEPKGALVQLRSASGEHVDFEGTVHCDGRRITLTWTFAAGQICNLIVFN
jgi:hypothetical protein